MPVQFGTWYALNSGPRREWPGDFARARDSGFDFVVLWHMLPDVGRQKGDVRNIVLDPGPTLAALDDAGKAGLRAYTGVWHPYYMGPVRGAWHPRWAGGGAVRGPNIFNLDWLRQSWAPYVRRVAASFARHPAFAGAYMDDTFPVLPKGTSSFLSYTPADAQRFRDWLRRRYVTVANLNHCHRDRRKYRSFARVFPPKRPQDSLALWNDWMLARAEWCEDFARRTREAWIDGGAKPRRELVLSDQDYHMRCSALQFGVDYPRLLRHFDRFEIYMAAEHTRLSRRELLATVEDDVRKGMAIAAGKPFQFHTWFADQRTLAPMSPSLLEAVIDRAASLGAAAVEVYTYNVYDWRRKFTRRDDLTQLPPFREMSLKYNPAVLRTIARAAARLKH